MKYFAIGTDWNGERLEILEIKNVDEKNKVIDILFENRDFYNFDSVFILDEDQVKEFADKLYKQLGLEIDVEPGCSEDDTENMVAVTVIRDDELFEGYLPFKRKM